MFHNITGLLDQICAALMSIKYKNFNASKFINTHLFICIYLYIYLHLVFILKSINLIYK